MEDIPAFKPQWLMQGPVTATGASSLWATVSHRAGADQQVRGDSSKYRSSEHDRDQSSRQSSSRRSSGPNGSRRLDRDGMGKSRAYANFSKNANVSKYKGKDREKDSRDRASRSVRADRDGFQSFITCKPERDRLNRVRSKADTRSNGLVSPTNGSTSRSNTIGMPSEREFPQLSSENKNVRQGISRVPSPGITTPIQRLPPFTAYDGWNSVLAEVPVSSEPKEIPVASSISQVAPNKQPEAAPNSGTTLSMAETVMQAPLKMSFGPQISIDAQKIEERTMRANTLRPMTSISSKSSVTNSIKTKGARNADPASPIKAIQQSLILSANGSARAPVKTDLSKFSQSGSFKILSREQNGTAHAVKDRPSNPVSPPPALPASMESQKKPFVNQNFKVPIHDLHVSKGAYGDTKSKARGRHNFFESLRTKCTNGSSSAIESSCEPSPSSVIDVQQDSCVSLGKNSSLFRSGMKCMGNGNCSCGETNSSEGSERHLSDNENNSSSEPADIADGGSQKLLVENRGSDSSSELADTGDEGFQVSVSYNAEGSSSSAPADSEDGDGRSQSGNEEASSSSEATEAGDDEYPAEAILSAEDLAFMVSLGWSKDEKVQPLDLEEIADCVRSNKGLEQRLLSMEANANIKIILLNLFRQS